MATESLFGKDLCAATTFRPRSRHDLIGAVENMLGDSLVGIIDTHNTQSIIFILKSSEGKYVIKAEYGENTRTQQEIAWYKEVGLQAPNLSAIFTDGYIGDNFALT